MAKNIVGTFETRLDKFKATANAIRAKRDAGKPVSQADNDAAIRLGGLLLKDVQASELAQAHKWGKQIRGLLRSRLGHFISKRGKPWIAVPAGKTNANANAPKRTRKAKAKVAVASVEPPAPTSDASAVTEE